MKLDKIWFGGDYNPDQWDEKTIDEDMRLFKKAHINMVTLPVFSWAKLEPEEGRYDFEWLDRLLDKLAANGIGVNLATPTTAQPAWLSTKYPEVLPVDIQGRRRTHGMRVFFCYNSPKYRERSAAIAGAMAQRYAHHPALKIWHIANEYGTYCYCPICRGRFIEWLQKRYGSLEKLNERWFTSFWGRTLYDWQEIQLPTELNDDYRFNPTIQLDYMRFVTDSTADCFTNEYQAIRKYCPDIPIQTNMSGYIKKLDQFVMAKRMDIIGWDNYPWPTDDKSLVALKHDIMRGLKGGQSYMLAEQSPNQQNWQPYNKLKRPGEVRLLSYQAMARGADTCLFFQMRQSIAGQEKFHGAIISHAGHENTRVFREAEKLGHELEALGGAFLRGRTPAKAALLMDWNNWWALELASGPSKDMDYLRTLARYYKPFHDRNIPVDFLNPAGDTDYSGYSLVVAPMLYMTKPGVAERLTEYVKAGGTLVATVMSGIADENDRCVFGEYPGKLKDALGVWVEETDALRPEESNRMVMEESAAFPEKSYSCSFLCDLMHARTAQPLAVYGDDFYAGMPCVTKNRFGKGAAYYIGTQPEDRFLADLLQAICKETGLKGLFTASAGVEITRRVNERGTVIFVLNHNPGEAWADFGAAKLTDLLTGKRLTGKQAIAGRDALILRLDEDGGELP